MMLNCLIVDSEPSFLDLLEKYVGRTPFLQLTDRLESASDALQCVRSASREIDEGIDIIFWGLESSPLHYEELTRLLAEWSRSRIKVIFTCELSASIAYEFSRNILGQLVRPFSYKQFLDASMSAHEWFLQDENRTSVLTFEASADSGRQRDSIWVKDGYRQVNLLFSDIICIERVKDHVLVRLVDGEQVTTPMTLKALTEQLPKDEFVRVHRSYIVHLPDVNVIEHGHIVFDQMRIPISNSYRNNFMKMLAQRVLVMPKVDSEASVSEATVGGDISIGVQEASLPD